MDEGKARQDISNDSSSSESSSDENDILSSHENKKAKNKIDYCEHLNSISLNELKKRFGSEKFQKQMKKQEIYCDRCSLGAPHIWACLTQSCDSYGCGRSDNRHAMEHFQKFNAQQKSNEILHSVCINLTTKMIWCYKCDFEPMNDGSDEEITPKDIRDIIFPKQKEELILPLESEKKKESGKGICGLSNLGNTCYLNSALQALSNCPPFSEYFRTIGSNIPSTKKNLLSHPYSILINTLWSGNYNSVAPSQVVSAIGDVNPMFRGWAQQDAQELLHCVLDRLHEELKRPIEIIENSNGDKKTDGKPNTKTDYRSPVSDIFEGILESRVKCLKCNKDSLTKDKFYDLSVSMPGSKKLPRKDDNQKKSSGWLTTLGSYLGLTRKTVLLEDCLYAFTSTEYLTGSERYMCEFCKTLNDSEKTLSIAKLPEILCIHVKRFRYDSYFSSKISDHVVFPIQGLDVSKFLMNDYPHEDKDVKYNLIAIINHRGGIGGGHYVAYCKNEKNGKWYEFDDRTVTEVNEETVLNVEAYVIFFQKEISKERIQEIAKVKNLIKAKDGLESPVYISKYWFMKWETTSHPGPMSSDFLCKHGYVLSEYLVNIKDEFAILPYSAYEILHSRYKGGVGLTKLTECEHCKKEKLEFDRRRELERKEITERDKTSLGPNESWYLLSAKWLQRWYHFMGGANVLPGPITNKEDLLDANNKPKPHLVRAKHYRGVSPSVYKYFEEVYGGGPPIPRQNLDIYDKAGEEPGKDQLSNNHS